MKLNNSQFLDHIFNTTAWHLFKGAIANGGHTAWRDGYAAKFGYLVGGGELPTIINENELTPEKAYALSLWAEKRESTQHLGSWYNSEDGNYYFDVVEHYTDLSDALFVAHCRNEIAIYDIENSKEITA